MLNRTVYKIKINKRYRNKKIKEQFRNSYIETASYSIGMNNMNEYEVFPNLISGCHKHFSTKQEKSLYEMHQYEYFKEYNLKLRGKRSKRNLADPWDDYPSFVYDSLKSWKHSTKRKKQYYKND